MEYKITKLDILYRGMFYITNWQILNQTIDDSKVSNKI